MTTRVEYAPGWVDAAGKWHPFGGAGRFADEAEAREQLKKLRTRKGYRREVAAAVRAGRVEVRTRTITTTPWVTP